MAGRFIKGSFPLNKKKNGVAAWGKQAYLPGREKKKGKKIDIRNRKKVFKRKIVIKVTLYFTFE